MVTTTVPAYRVAPTSVGVSTYRVLAATVVTRPTVVYRRTAVTSANTIRAVVVQKGGVALAPTVMVLRPATVVTGAVAAAPVQEPAEGIVMEPGTELEAVTLLRKGDSIEPEDIVVPVELVAEPEAVAEAQTEGATKAAAALEGHGDMGEPTPGMDADKARVLYDQWGDGYADTVLSWGYQMPEKIAQALAEALGPEAVQSATVLDAGAGDGLSGEALRKAGFGGAMTGTDLSPKLCELATARGVYQTVQEVDLSQPLPFADNSFGAVACVGVLTYLKPDCGVLQEFCRISQPGAMISFNIRTDHLPSWEGALSALEGTWEKRSQTEPLAYLPNNPDYAEKVLTVIFVYRVL